MTSASSSRGSWSVPAAPHFSFCKIWQISMACFATVPWIHLEFLDLGSSVLPVLLQPWRRDSQGPCQLPVSQGCGYLTEMQVSALFSWQTSSVSLIKAAVAPTLPLYLPSSSPAVQRFSIIYLCFWGLWKMKINTGIQLCYKLQLLSKRWPLYRLCSGWIFAVNFAVQGQTSGSEMALHTRPDRARN